MLTRDELEALVEVFAANLTKTPSKLAEAKVLVAFHKRKKAGKPIEDEPAITALLEACGLLGTRLVHDKEADVGVVLSKVFADVTDAVKLAAAGLKPVPTTTKAVVQPQLLTLQIFKRIPLQAFLSSSSGFEEVHDRTESFGPGVIKVGSMETSRLRITDDPKVARMHAVIEFDVGSVRIIDLGSESGTIVNGEKVKHAELKDGYVVRLGNTMLGVSLSTPT